MNTLDRFEGNVAWSKLDDLQRVAIGSMALEFIAAWQTVDQVVYPRDGSDPLLRAASHAEVILIDRLCEVMAEAIPVAMLQGIDGQPLLPSLLGQVCRHCGCSQRNACFPACHWVEADLCSACAEAEMTDENNCPGHVASALDRKVCAHCGTHIDELRPDDPINLQGSGPAPIEPRED